MLTAVKRHVCRSTPQRVKIMMLLANNFFYCNGRLLMSITATEKLLVGKTSKEMMDGHYHEGGMLKKYDSRQRKREAARKYREYTTNNHIQI